MAGLPSATLWLADEVDLGGPGPPTRLDPDRLSPGLREGGKAAGEEEEADRPPVTADPARAAPLARTLSWPRVRSPIALTSDGASRLLVGFEDGELVALTWTGSARSRARPFDLPSAFPGGKAAAAAAAVPLPPPLRRSGSLSLSGSVDGGDGPPSGPPSSAALDGPGAGMAAFAHHLAARLVEDQAEDAAAAAAAGVPTVSSLPPLPRRPPSSLGGASASGLGLPLLTTPPDAPLVALNFCRRARALVAAFGDGRVCVAATQGPGAPADALCIPRWVRGPTCAASSARRPSAPPSRRPSLSPLPERRADAAPSAPPPVTAVAVSGEAGLIAVGLADGRTELHPLAAPSRGAALASATRAHAASLAAAAAAARAGASAALLATAVSAAAAAAAADTAAAAQAPPLRVLSPWADDGGAGPGHGARAGGLRRGAGPVAALAWSPCGGTLAVGWAGGGLCGWSVAGVRGFASAPPGSGGGGGGADAPVAPGLEAPVASLAWSSSGGRLLILQPPADASSPARLLELALARAIPSLRAGPGVSTILADDRLVLVSDAASPSGQPQVSETRPPAAYVDANWPLRLAAAAPDGRHVAVAGRRGLALLATGNRGGGPGDPADRWRLFGDVAQERGLAVAALAWLPGAVVVVAAGEGAPGAGAVADTQQPPAPPSSSSSSSRPDLRLYSRSRLDPTGLLASRRLARLPVALDAAGGHVLAAFAPMDLLLLRYEACGAAGAAPGDASSAPGRLVAVRELSILASGPPVRAVALASLPDTRRGADGGLATVAAGTGSTHLPPAHAAVLRYGGGLGVLDLDTGAEAPVASGVESVWLPPWEEAAEEGEGEGRRDGGGEAGAPPPPVSPPWWAYGPSGTRMLLPDGGDVRAACGARAVATPATTTTTSASATPCMPSDPELEFDGEVHPVGVSPGPAGSLVGVRQRAVRPAGAPSMPLFVAAAATQPTLSVLLRRLLSAGRAAEAGAVADAAAASGAPHFARSLEWLVAAALVAGGEGGGRGAAADTATPPPLLTAATDLARRFPAAFADMIVAVARKTDAALWPRLFAAAGPPSDLLCDAAAAGDLDGAACCLLVVDRVEGPAAAAGPTLALLKAALEGGRYGLAAELLRFACPPGEGAAAPHPNLTALRPPAVLGRAPGLAWNGDGGKTAAAAAAAAPAPPL